MTTSASRERVPSGSGLPGLRRHRALIAALAVDAAGSGVAGPLLLLYLTRVAGLELRAAGILLTAGTAVSLAVPAVAGHLGRRFGSRNVLIAAQLLQAAAMAGLLAGRGPAALAAAAVAGAVGQRAFWCTVFTLIAGAADAAGDATGRDRWFAAASMIQNAGLALGGLLAGALLLLPGSLPFVTALALNGLSFAASAAAFAASPSRAGPPPPAARRRRVVPGGRYLTLIAANTLFAFCSVLLGTGLPVYALDFLHAPRWLVMPLLALVTVLGATCQGIGVRRTASLRRVTVLALAGALWLAWGLAFAGLAGLSGGLLVAGLVAGTLAYAAAEVLQGPAASSLTAAQAPPGERENYLSWAQYSFAIAVTAAPSAFTVLVSVSPRLPWLVAAAAAGGGGALAYLAAGRTGD